jgi:hypothetical protein
MRRADRRTPNDDNAHNHPSSRRQEPASLHDLKQSLITARVQRDEARTQLKEVQHGLTETTAQLTLAQQEFQTSQLELYTWKERTEQNHQLYIEEQKKYQHALCLFEQEQIRATELLAKYEEADALRVQYLTQYNEAQIQLKFERRSKAGIKGWETRRKLENERLKQQISDMVVLLSESLKRNEASVNYLYLVGDRMDRIQRLMDSAELESSQDPVRLLEKLMRVWLLVQKILAE